MPTTGWPRTYAFAQAQDADSGEMPTLTATSADDLVDRLHRLSFDGRRRSRAEFMADLAERLTPDGADPVRADSAEHLVADLTARGYWRTVAPAASRHWLDAPAPPRRSPLTRR